MHQQGPDTTTPSGKAMFQMMGLFAELERSPIRERVRIGLARAERLEFTWIRPRIRGWMIRKAVNSVSKSFARRLVPSLRGASAEW
jgi:DNA invertase Pin-like site-specific DNA recombinase